MNNRYLGFLGLFGLFGLLGYNGEPPLFALFGLFALFALFAAPRPNNEVSNESQPSWVIMFVGTVSVLVAGTMLVTYLIL